MNLLAFRHYHRNGRIFESNRGPEEEGICGEVVVVKLDDSVVDLVLCE